METGAAFEKLKEMDIVHLKSKAVKYALGLIGVYLVLHLASKFIDDNFDFRVAAISNKKRE